MLIESIDQIESQTISNTLKEHEKEVGLINQLLEAFLVGFNLLGKFTIAEDNELEYAWLLLSIRSFNSIRCASGLLQKGYYSQSVICMRSAFEDWLTAKDGEKNPKTINALLHRDADYFRKWEGRYSEMAKRVEKRFGINGAWRTIYGQFSVFAHARNQSLMILVNPKTKELRLGSHYDNDLFLASYQSYLAVASITPELLYKLLGDKANKWWEETLPILQEAKKEIERIGKEYNVIKSK